MTTKIYNNQKGGYVTVSANASGFVALNQVGASTGGLLGNGANTVGEVVQEMNISEIIWSNLGTANMWDIKRGGNTVFKCYGQNGQINVQRDNLHLECNSFERASNVVFTLSGAAAKGSIVLKLHKRSDIGN